MATHKPLICVGLGLGLTLLSGCKKEQDPSLPDAALPTDAEVAAADEDTDAQAAFELPANWSGEGIMASRTDVPRSAPIWTRTRAEIVSVDRTRYLQTTGKAARIRNEALARSTAVARARAEAAHWTGTDRLVGSEVVDVWQDPKTHTAMARVAMPIPDKWDPGQPWPESDTDPASGEETPK